MDGEFDVNWKKMYESAMKKLKREQERNQRYCRIIKFIFQLDSRKEMSIYDAINRYCKSKDRDEVLGKIRKGKPCAKLEQILANAIKANDPYAVAALHERCDKPIIKRLSTVGYALKKGSLESAILILIHVINDDPKFKPAKNNSPLHCAAEGDSYELAKVFIDFCNANVTNSSKETPLHLAVNNNSIEVSKLLLEAGSSPTAKDEDGLTPVHNAAKQGNKKILSMLIGENNDICKMKSNKGSTPLEEAFVGLIHYYYYNTGELLDNLFMEPFTETIKYLISIGSDINTKVNHGEDLTLLQSALLVKSYKLVRAVLDAGALFENDSLLTLWKGEKINRYQLIILSCIASGRIREENLTSDKAQKLKKELSQMEKDMIEISEFLVTSGADVNKANKNNKTPLMYAVILNMKEGVRFLINAGANPKARDVHGNTIAHYAAIHNNEEIKALVGFDSARKVINDAGETVEAFAERFLDKIPEYGKLFSLMSNCLLI